MAAYGRMLERKRPGTPVHRMGLAQPAGMSGGCILSGAIVLGSYTWCVGTDDIARQLGHSLLVVVGVVVFEVVNSSPFRLTSVPWAVTLVPLYYYLS